MTKWALEMVVMAFAPSGRSDFEGGILWSRRPLRPRPYSDCARTRSSTKDVNACTPPNERRRANREILAHPPTSTPSASSSSCWRSPTISILQVTHQFGSIARDFGCSVSNLKSAIIALLFILCLQDMWRTKLNEIYNVTLFLLSIEATK